MQGNTFGRIFRVTSWGESHGAALGVVIDGCPSGLHLTTEDFLPDMRLRQGGEFSFSTARKEEDFVQIESGVFEGITTGTPISLRVENRNTKSQDYDAFRDTPRPGHADLTTFWKHGHRDHRGGGRSSARETAARVAAGVVAKKILHSQGVEIFAFLSKLGKTTIDTDFPNLYDHGTSQFMELLPTLRKLRNKNPLRCLKEDSSELLDQIEQVKANGDSLGGEISAVALNLPRGLGEPVFDKLNALLAHAYFSLPAAVSVDIGGGTKMSELYGSEIRDEIKQKGCDIEFGSNSHGGLLGGMSTGNPLWSSIKFHSPTSISQTIGSVDLKTGEAKGIQVEGRHDSFPLPRAIPVVESMMAVTLADATLANTSSKFK